jgi:hypothetical protein
MIAQHFIDTWGPVLKERSTPRKRVIARDLGLCQVPGCSRPAVHAHHMVFRSAGGSDDPSNLVSLCAAHHLHGVHMGWLKVFAESPDALRWQLGVRAGAVPLLEVIVPRNRWPSRQGAQRARHTGHL